MVLDKDISKRLLEDKMLDPAHVEVVDTTQGGCGSMFAVTIVSDAFQGLIPLKRHRLAHSVLKKEIEDIHAITLTLFTVAQYKAKFPLWTPAAASASVASASAASASEPKSAASASEPKSAASASEPKSAASASEPKSATSVSATKQDDDQGREKAPKPEAVEQ
ncbi:hypothetical protein GGF42_004823 [Coemansia sp. RSA 2424]|nr:hypothetical protein GGF42_004823 [Coemansia sp. RSA 2424]